MLLVFKCVKTANCSPVPLRLTLPDIFTRAIPRLLNSTVARRVGVFDGAKRYIRWQGAQSLVEHNMEYNFEEKKAGTVKSLKIGKFYGTKKDRYHLWRGKAQERLEELDLWKIITGEETEPEWTPRVMKVSMQAKREYFLDVRAYEADPSAMASPGLRPDVPQPTEMDNPISEEDWPASQDVIAFQKRKKMTSNLIIEALGDDVYSMIIHESGNPTAMWKILEDTYSAKTGSNILSLLQSLATKKLGRNEQMANHLMYMNEIYVQLSAIQASNTDKDLTVTGDVFKICMLLASLSDIGEYNAVIEAIRGVSDNNTASDYRAVQNRLLESYKEKHPGKGIGFQSKTGSSQGQVSSNNNKPHVRGFVAKTKKSISCNNCRKRGHKAEDCWSNKQSQSGQAAGTSASHRSKKKGSTGPSKTRHDDETAFTSVVVDPNEDWADAEDTALMAITNLEDGSDEDAIYIPSGQATEKTMRKQADHALKAKEVGFAEEDMGCMFLVDSGASRHICTDIRMFQNLYECEPRKIYVGNNDIVTTNKVGTVVLDGHVKLLKVLYVPGFAANLISLSALDKHGIMAVFSKGFVTIGRDLFNDDSQRFLHGEKNSYGLYEVHCSGDRHVDPIFHTTSGTSRIEAERPEFSYNATPKTVLEAQKLWHDRLGHTNERAIRKLNKRKEETGVELDSKPDTVKCEECVESNMTSSARTSSLTPADAKLGDIVFSDVCGPFSIKGYNGDRYFVTFTDGATKLLYLETIKKKGAEEILHAFKTFYQKLKTQFDVKVKRLHTDNGGEFDNDLMWDFATKNGMELTTIAPYEPRSNGVAERINRTLLNKARAMMLKANIGYEYWPEAIEYAVYLHNRTPPSRSEGATPYEKVYGKAPSLKDVRIYGCLAFGKVPEEKRKKLSEKSVRAALLQALPGKQYKLLDLDNGDVFYVRQAKFDETSFPSYGSKAGKFSEHEDTESEHDSDSDFDDVPYGTMTDSESDSDDDRPLSQWTQRSSRPSTSRTTTTSAIYHTDSDDDTPFHDAVGEPYVAPNDNAGGDEEPGGTTEPGGVAGGSNANDDAGVTEGRRTRSGRVYNTALVSKTKTDSFDEPTLREAMKRDDADLWKEAVQKEIDVLNKRGTWELVPRPPKQRVLPSKVVLKIKRNPDGTVDRYKARLVVLGCLQQPEDYEETFSPVVDFSTIRTALTLAVHEGEVCHHVDITGAFLYGTLDEILYMQLPKGFEDLAFPTHVCRLIKSLYGLKQAPRVWYQYLAKYLLELGFKAVPNTLCVFERKLKGARVRMLVYVDDCLIISRSVQAIQAVKDMMEERFSITDLGPAKYFLGVEITSVPDGYFLHQSGYIRTILESHGMLDCKPAPSPMDPGLLLDLTAKTAPSCPPEATFSFPYRNAIGQLLYLTTKTRPDIAAAVGVLSRKVSAPQDIHWSAVKRVLRYLKGTSTTAFTSSLHQQCWRLMQTQTGQESPAASQSVDS